MANEIATLGLALDSRPITQGAKALDDLTRAAKPAQTAATALEKAVADVGKSTGVLGAKVKPATGALDDLTRAAKPAQVATTALEKATTDLGKATGPIGAKVKPTNDALANVAKSGALARHEMVNLSRQLTDVAVSVQGGMSLMTVGFQQFPQILDIFSASKTATVGGAFKQITSGILGAITPMRVLGVVGLATGAIAAAFYSNWHKVTLGLDDTARSIGTTTRELSKLQAASSFKGISADEFTKGVKGFAQGVYDARAGMGGLAEVFQINNRRAGDFNSSLNTAADLIKNARDDQQRLVLLQQMGLPATMQWVRLLSGGADGLKKAKDAAAEFAANDNLVASARHFDEAWNRTWTNFGLNARSAFQRAMEFGSGFFDRMDRLAARAGNASIWTSLLPKDHAETAAKWGVTPLTSFEQRFNASGANPAASNTTLADALRGRADSIRNGNTIDPAAAQRDNQMQQQRLGLLGQVATVNEQIKAGELAITAARMQPGNKITDADVKRIQDFAKANALGVIQIRSQTNANALETATLGMTTGQAAAYAAVQQKINDEKLKGNALGPDQIAQLRTEAGALGEAAQRAENMRAAYDGLTSSGQTFLSTIRSGGSVWDGFKSAGVSALDAISSKLMKMATDQLWTSAFGGSGGGNFFSNLFGGGGSATSALPLPGSSAFIGPTFATGGYTGSGGKYEPAGIVHKGEYVIDAASTRRIGVPNLNRLRGYAEGGIVDQMSPLTMARVAAPNAGSTGGGAPVSVNINIDATGADAAGLARVQQELAGLKADLPARIVAESRKAQQRRQL